MRPTGIHFRAGPHEQRIPHAFFLTWFMFILGVSVYKHYFDIKTHECGINALCDLIGSFDSDSLSHLYLANQNKFWKSLRWESRELGFKQHIQNLARSNGSIKSYGPHNTTIFSSSTNPWLHKFVLQKQIIMWMVIPFCFLRKNISI